MLRKVFGAIVVIAVVFVVIVNSRPDRFSVDRSATIAAPPATIFPILTDFGQWSRWSPWQKLDPAMKTSSSGTPGSVGHAYSWSGNDKVGEGRMTLSAVTPGERVEIQLEFFKPWEANNKTTFVIRPDGANSRVTWSMVGMQDFKMKAAGLFMNMDAKVGGDFERGLQDLKMIAEKAAAAPTTTTTSTSQ
jgi:uncharacterized protein YndB with AHSA1/START domain